MWINVIHDEFALDSYVILFCNPVKRKTLFSTEQKFWDMIISAEHKPSIM